MAMFVAGSQGSRRGLIVAGAIALGLLGSSSAALAQCGVTNVAGPAGTGVPLGTVGPGAGILGSFASTVSAQVSSAVSDTNVVFQAGQGSAFVSAPSNPPPNSPG